MRKFLPLALLLLVLAALAAPGAQAAQTVTVHVGESTTISLNYQFSELAVGNPAVADYIVRGNTPQGAELIINGKKPGMTNLLIFDTAGKQKDEFAIRVIVRDLGAYLKQLKSVIGQVAGVRYRIAGDKIVIEGQAVVPTDIARIQQVVGESPQVVNMVTLSPLTLKVLAKKISGEISNPAVQVRAVGQKLVLSGVIYGQKEAERVLTLAKLYYPDVVSVLDIRQADLRPGADEMIQVTAHFMEVANAAIDGWGVNWSPGASGQASGAQGLGSGAAGFAGAITGTISNLFPKFSRAKEANQARVLETSSVSVRSGEKADFHSGGEMGIPTPTQSGGTTITFKEYGVFLDVLPIAQGENITLRIKVEVSSPSGTSPGGFINFKKSNMSTVQYCQSGDSVALGGLISQQDAKVFDAMPPGAEGAFVQLYKSQDFRKNRSQLVVFVTPLILKGGAKDAHQELKGIVEENFDSYQPRKR